MTFADLADIAGGSLHRDIVEHVPSLKRGRVWCHTCGYSQAVDSARCLATGWPTHCGHTMSIDSPEERKAPR
jgi:hypothetical protein